jgi:tol-pal system protein YbgF
MFHSRPVRFAAVALLFAGLSSLPAHAVSKDMIQLQTQIQQLQDAVARLQQSNDERMGVMKDLVQQTADAVNKMSVAVNGMELRLQNQQEAAGAKSDQLSGQVQSLNDTLDELKARMARMEKTLSDIQNQQQSANAILGNLPQGTGAPAAAQPQPSTVIPPTAPSDNGGPADQPAAPITRPDAKPTASDAPPVADMYRTAYSDYMGAKYDLASSEFSDLIKAYPDDNLAGNAYFYIGEINSKTQKPTAAVKSYDHLLERYPDNAKIPAAHLHKGEALLAMKQNDAGIRELRSLIQRFPQSPEASQARSKLNGMGVPITPRR